MLRCPSTIAPLCLSALAAGQAAEARWVAPTELSFDGDPSEWGTGPPPVVLERADQLVGLGAADPTDAWHGPDDLSLELWVGWNETDLLLGGRLRDDHAQPNRATWYRGDSLELFLNTRDRAPEWDDDDFQVMLAPTFAERPWGVYTHSDSGPTASDGGFGGVEVAALATASGYSFEARIPWQDFGLFEVEAGLRLPFNFAVCDRDAGDDLDSYLTWTGEDQIARFADRRGELVLVGSRTAQGTAPAESARPSAWGAWLLLALVLLYGFALATRSLWRDGRARRRGAQAAVVAILVSFGVVAALRWRQAAELEARRAELESYGAAFGALLSSGALGHPEPAELVRRARALLAGESIAAIEPSRFVPFGPPREGEPGLETVTLGPPEATWQRGIPLRPFRAPQGTEAAAVLLEPGERRVFPLEEAPRADALHLVLAVHDERWLSFAERPIPILRVQAFADGEPVGPPITLRHRRHLQLDSEEFVSQPGIELARVRPGGRRGRLVSTGLLLELEAQTTVDELVVENLAAASAYPVEIVAASARVPAPDFEAPPGLRLEPGGGLAWAAWRPDLAAEVHSLVDGAEPVERALAAASADAWEGGGLSVERELGLGREASFTLTLRPKGLVRRGRSAWDVLPIAVAAVLMPFLVAMGAEALAASRRIRWKLAVGFAVSSAVPLLALTLLLEATLHVERTAHERERLLALVKTAEEDLDDDLAELEARAELLLHLAELRAEEARRFPATTETEPATPLAFPSSSSELDRWWGRTEPDEVRFLERVDAEGRLTRVGSGPAWQSLPLSTETRTGLVRLWGRLYAAGVAHSPSSVEQPLTALVLRPPRFAETSDRGSDRGLRVLGAGRSRAPTVADLELPGTGSIRRAVRGPDGELAAVLAADPAERGEPILGTWSLTELLLAAGLTAVFTAMLFALILTSHIVPPIERLDRALREGLPEEIPVAVPDEVGHLTNAIQAFAGELADRVDQLEALQVAQTEMSGRLDAELARRAVLSFCVERTGARAWITWAGDSSSEPALYGADGLAVDVDLSPASTGARGRGFLALARSAGEVVQWIAGADGLGLVEPERTLFAGARRLLALPLVAGGECRGAIVLAFATTAEPAGLDFLRAVASQAAVVLENAHLYHQAVNDPVTGFLSEPGFLSRVTEEIERARGSAEAGVLVVQVRLRGLPKDDARATERLREAARRMRRSVHGLALFGRSGSADLRAAIPWQGEAPDCARLASRIADGIGAAAWPDGEVVGELAVAWGAWPSDGPSARFVLALLEERLVAIEPRGAVRPAVEQALPPDIVAESPLYLDLLDSLRRIAAQEVTLLVTGETGVGKDKVAELCHRWSPRAKGPLVHIHCPSLSDDLIEDELFGHEVGAFTGAHSRRMSPFEYAKGGTIVLDEVGGLSPAGQVALLRVLENREVLPLGATRRVPLDVRIVATTSLDLAQEVEGGRFRGDLWYRLNAAQLTVPPLRLRRQALPALVERTLRRFNETADRPVTGVSPAVLDALYEHDWPGNLRELENVLARGLVLSAGSELEIGPLDLVPESLERAGLELSPRQREILAVLAVGSWVTSSEVALRLGVSGRTALRDLRGLAEVGLLAREGSKRGTRFRRTARPVA